jgi:hypothetical protein
MAVYKTARGNNIDLEKLKLYNETVIAVGNTQTNVRGDIVQGGRIIKTREQVMQEHYNLSGNNIPKHPKHEVVQQIEEDDIAMGFEPPPADPIPVSTAPTPASVEVEDPVSEDDRPRGGLADAVARSQELNEKLAASRKRI